MYNRKSKEKREGRERVCVPVLHGLYEYEYAPVQEPYPKQVDIMVS